MITKINNTIIILDDCETTVVTLERFEDKISMNIYNNRINNTLFSKTSSLMISAYDINKLIYYLKELTSIKYKGSICSSKDISIKFGYKHSINSYGLIFKYNNFCKKSIKLEYSVAYIERLVCRLQNFKYKTEMKYNNKSKINSNYFDKFED